MRTKICRAAAPCLAALALAGCSGLPGADIESLLRAPRLSGEASAVQKALNSYLGGVATLRYKGQHILEEPMNTDAFNEAYAKWQEDRAASTGN